MRKVLIFIVTILFIFSTSACSDKQEISYDLQMKIDGTGGLEYSTGFVKYLTPEDNMLETDTHYFPDISFKIVFIIEKRVNKMVTFRKEIYPHEENLEGLRHSDSIYFNTYTIEDKEGEIIHSKFIKTIHSFSYYPDLGILNSYQLQRIAGKHIVTFIFPEIEDWNIPETEFKLIVNVQEDLRADGVSIRVSEPGGESGYVLISKEQTGDHDMYIMNTRWNNNKNHKKLYMPAFCAYTKNEENQDVLLASFISSYIPSGGYADDGDIIIFSRKLDEKYEYNSWSDIPYKPGLYLCSVIYWRSENYKPVEYKCYIVIPN